MNLKFESLNKSIDSSWKENLILSYWGEQKEVNIEEISLSLSNECEFFFVNHKNSMLGVGGVGTVTRAILKIIPTLKMVCYDPTYDSSLSNNVITVNLNSEKAEMFHGQYAKLYLWPVLHSIESSLSEKDIESCRKAFLDCSKKFADTTLSIAYSKKKAIYWINDYNLACVPYYIRQQNPTCKIIFSLRTPFGVNDLPRFLKPDENIILKSIIQSDIVSFHRVKDLLHFLKMVEDCFVEDQNVYVNWADHTITYGEHLCIPRVFPMGNDPSYRIKLSKFVESQEVKKGYANMVKGKLITSVSRFDKSKGVDFELDCIESLLKYYPDIKNQFTFLRLSYISDRKNNTLHYKKVFERVIDRIERINETFGNKDWKPVIGLYENKLSDIEMTGLFKATDILMIASLGDGFNHIAVESILSKQSEDNPLQLVTTNVGVTDYLDGFTMINHNDITESAMALYNSIQMDKEEVSRRYTMLLSYANKLYASNWALSILQSAVDISKVPILYKINKSFQNDS